MGNTTIPWADMVWNPTLGCSKGCDYCYARKLHQIRYGAFHREKNIPPCYAEPFERIQTIPERLMQPLHWRRSLHIFVDSIGGGK